jgi:hypothetical protein
MINVVDLSGYSFSGKSAVYDLLNEFEGYYSHSKEFEFDLIRVQGGILDLKNALVDSWSPIRSTEAIRNFIKLIRLIGGDGRVIQKFSTIGANYDKFFPNFTSISQRYACSLVSSSWDCDWPFASYGLDNFGLLAYKIKRKLVRMPFETFYLSRLTSNEFCEKTKFYLDQLFMHFEQVGFKTIILNNAFEPVNPERSIIFFHSAKCIVVDRDPRDMYLSALYSGKILGLQIGNAVVGSSVMNFIERYKIFHATAPSESEDVYRLNYEDLIVDYENQVNQIRSFLSESIGDYTNKGKFFNPEISSKNMRQWKNIKDENIKSDIYCIEKHLSKYCLNY